MIVNNLGVSKNLLVCVAIILPLVTPLAEAGIASCYTGKVNSKGEYSDT